MNSDIKNLLRNKHKVFKRYKKNRYIIEDKVIHDHLRNYHKCKRKMFYIGTNLANPSTDKKSDWELLNSFLYKLGNAYLDALLDFTKSLMV